MATAYNDITGDNLVSRGLTKEGEAAFERIFGVKERKQWIPPSLPLKEYPDNNKDENDSNNFWVCSVLRYSLRYGIYNLLMSSIFYKQNSLLVIKR